MRIDFKKRSNYILSTRDTQMQRQKHWKDRKRCNMQIGNTIEMEMTLILDKIDVKTRNITWNVKRYKDQYIRERKQLEMYI